MPPAQRQIAQATVTGMRALTRFAIAVFGLSLLGCAAPLGSLAAPVSDAPGGAARVSLSGARGQSWGDRHLLLRSSDRHSFVGGHVDFAQGERRWWGLGAGAAVLHKPETTQISPMLSYRGEAPLSPGGDTTLFAVFQMAAVKVDKEAKWNLLSLSYLPVVAPLFGLRQYIPIGPGGLVVSQGAWVDVTPPSILLPGSFAADLPLGPIHLLPELRWDLLAGALRDLKAGATLSGYVSLVLQLD